MTLATPAAFGLFFDADFYQRQLASPAADPVSHFRAIGDAQGLDPSPYFSTQHYKARYPDWQARGHPTALDDFLAHDARADWRCPHPLIDPDAYLRFYPDVAAAGGSPSGHFARHGDAEGRHPSDSFDASFYKRAYLGLNDDCAFTHYIATGRAAGHLAKPVSRSFAETATAAAQALAGKNCPILLAVHDAQKAGAPLLVRDVARGLIARGYAPVFALRDGGPNLPEFQQLGPVFLLAEGWDVDGLFAGVAQRGRAPVLVNSAEAVELASAAAKAGLPTRLMIHEMRPYLEARGLLAKLIEAQDQGVGLVASFARMAEALQPELGRLPVLRPGVTLPPSSLDAFRACRRFAKGRVLFIGAGNADRRKGFDRFLDAAAALHARLPSAGFVWLGALDPWAKGLAQNAQAAGLPLELPGFVSDSLAHYAVASVYLLTSREDPGPTTLIHAAATGTPFVGYASDIGLRGVADPLGCFVPDGDQHAFVAAALAYGLGDTATSRHARRALLRPHLGIGRYCDEMLRLFA